MATRIKCPEPSEVSEYVSKLRPGWEDVKVYRSDRNLQIRALINGRHKDATAYLDGETPWKLAVLLAVSRLQSTGCCG